MKTSNFSLKSLISIFFYLSMTLLWAGCSSDSKDVKTQTLSPAAPRQPSSPTEDSREKPNPDHPPETPPGSSTPTPPPSNPAPVPTPVVARGRIVCEANLFPSTNFHQLPTFAGPNYPAAMMKFTVDSKQLEKIESPQLISTDQTKGLLLFQSVLNGKRDLMRSEVRWSTQAHPATKIAELIVANELTSTLLRYNLKIPSYLAIAEKNLLILPTSGRQNFEIRSLQENRSLAQIQLSTLTSIPAVASANSNWVIFYSLINEKLRLQPVHLSNQTLIEVSPLKSTNSQLAPWVTENTLAWIEVDFRDLFLRTINLQTKNQAIIKLDPSSLPLLNGKIEPDRLMLYTLNKQGLVRYDLNSTTHELSMVQTYSYPESLTRLTYFSHNQLTNLLSFEKGNKVIISLGNLGGLVSFDLIEKTWAQHGLIAPAYRCLNPSLQVENEL